MFVDELGGWWLVDQVAALVAVAALLLVIWADGGLSVRPMLNLVCAIRDCVRPRRLTVLPSGRTVTLSAVPRPLSAPSPRSGRACCPPAAARRYRPRFSRARTA